MKKQRFLLVFMLTALLTAGCGFAGSRGKIVFDDLRYPVSMSAYLYGPEREMVAKDRELKVVGRFQYETYHVAILYSTVALTRTRDIVEAVNREIKAKKGDGMVNLTITAKEGSLNYVPILNILPIWPGYTKLVVEGDIVRLSREGRANGPR